MHNSGDPQQAAHLWVQKEPSGASRLQIDSLDVIIVSTFWLADAHEPRDSPGHSTVTDWISIKHPAAVWFTGHGERHVLVSWLCWLRKPRFQTAPKWDRAHGCEVGNAGVLETLGIDKQVAS